MRPIVFFSMFIRSFALQAVWNFERMQNAGFAYALQPVLAALYPDPARRREMLLRHLGFFNIHPYMVSIILGVVVRIEEEQAAAGTAGPDRAAGIKNALAGPLAAIGDAFFWGTWRPFVALVSVGILLAALRFNADGHLFAAPLFFILAYNVFHIGFRLVSLVAAYRTHDRILTVIRELNFQGLLDRVRFIGTVLLFCVMGFYFTAYSRSLYDGIWFLGVFIVSILVGCTKLPPLVVFYGTLAAGVIMYAIRGYG